MNPPLSPSQRQQNPIEKPETYSNGAVDKVLTVLKSTEEVRHHERGMIDQPIQLASCNILFSRYIVELKKLRSANRLLGKL
jgi:hypothetical protein